MWRVRWRRLVRRLGAVGVGTLLALAVCCGPGAPSLAPPTPTTTATAPPTAPPTAALLDGFPPEAWDCAELFRRLPENRTRSLRELAVVCEARRRLAGSPSPTSTLTNVQLTSVHIAR